MLSLKGEADLNIKSRINKIKDDLEQKIFNNQEDINNSSILEGIKDTFNRIKLNSKQICPDETAYYDYLLSNLSIKEFLMTKEMYQEAYRVFRIMKIREVDVKTFCNYYFYILKLLLIYNKVDKECCNMCQGDLFYYYEKNNSIIVKVCGTCGTIFNANSDRIYTLEEKNNFNFRPTVKMEVLNLLDDETNKNDIITFRR